MAEQGFRDVNFFRPRGTAMRRETRAIVLVLLGWLAAIVGSQGIVCLLVRWEHAGLLPHWTFFNLPVSYWLTGQYLPLWFIILCVLYNLWMDRHASRDLDGTMRFRTRTGFNGEE